jgi:7-cyano-7-deazaguanine reductase
MAKKDAELSKRYRELDGKFKIRKDSPRAISPDLLLTFAYQHPDQEAEVSIETEEFSALCPWTGLPDLGDLSVQYVPDRLLLELKSFKYYLLSYRSVGIVQEHAAARILKDLVAVVAPRRMRVTLAYRVRGGLATTVEVCHP